MCNVVSVWGGHAYMVNSHDCLGVEITLFGGTESISGTIVVSVSTKHVVFYNLGADGGDRGA